MNEYETDPRRPPADSPAEQSQPTAELSRADHGQSGSTNAAGSTAADATSAPSGGASAAPAGPYQPSPWQPGYDSGLSAGAAGQPGWGGPAGTGGGGYPGAAPGSAAGGYSTGGYPTGGYPTSGYPTPVHPGGGAYPGGQPSYGPATTQPGPDGPQPPWSAGPQGPAGPGAPAGSSVPGRIGRALVLGVAGLVLLAGSSIAGGVVALALDDDPEIRTYTTPPIINSADLPGIAAAVQDSVVSIGTDNSGGSGVVLTEDGFVLTNNHVVEDAQGGVVRVVFADGKSADARVVGTDPPTDLAVVKAEGVSGLKPAKFGDSDAMRVGDTVLALGSPLGLQGSVTAGIISARDRSIVAGQQGFPGRGVATITGLLQTDAPINPGNSGGALVNTKGEVIGINTAIATSGQSSGNIGVGFAIPSNKAKAVAEALQRGEKVSHAYLGVSVTTGESGAVVASVMPGSPADQAGLQVGDVITRFGDQTIAESSDLVAAVQAGKVGDRVELTYLRNGQERRATVTLAEAS